MDKGSRKPVTTPSDPASGAGFESRKGHRSFQAGNAGSNPAGGTMCRSDVYLRRFSAFGGLGRESGSGLPPHALPPVGKSMARIKSAARRN